LTFTKTVNELVAEYNRSLTGVISWLDKWRLGLKKRQQM